MLDRSCMTISSCMLISFHETLLVSLMVELFPGVPDEVNNLVPVDPTHALRAVFTQNSKHWDFSV